MTKISKLFIYFKKWKIQNLMTQLNISPSIIVKIKTEILNKHFYCYYDQSIFYKKLQCERLNLECCWSMISLKFELNSVVDIRRTTSKL